MKQQLVPVDSRENSLILRVQQCPQHPSLRQHQLRQLAHRKRTLAWQLTSYMLLAIIFVKFACLGLLICTLHKQYTWPALPSSQQLKWPLINMVPYRESWSIDMSSATTLGPTRIVQSAR